jgi:hypothetical protein
MAEGATANRYAPAKPKGSGFRESGKGSPFSTDGEQCDKVYRSGAGHRTDDNPADVSGASYSTKKGLIP